MQQSLRSVFRVTAASSQLMRHQLPVATTAMPPCAVRHSSSSNISDGSMGKKWADREHAAESQYFNKKDAELLSKLAAKLHNHTAVPTNEAVASHRQAIASLFEKHGVSPVEALIDDIVEAKFN